jgi:murein DD-endopeptidase MepM/ murein hydrolase activator NlpD
MYEVQLHHADIRKQVRYFFISRKAMRRIVAGAVALAALLVTGLVLAPLGVQSLLLTRRLHVVEHRNEMQRQILAQRVERLQTLRRRVDAARLQQRQMSLILGSPQQAESGQSAGGFPEEGDVDLTIPEAVLGLRQANRLTTESKALLALADELALFAHEHQELTRSVPSICPVAIGSFVLTSPFGDRISPFTNTPHFHSGIDLAAHEGTEVIAPGDGRVVFAGRFPLRRNVRWWRYGNVVVLAHQERYLTIYAHLEEIKVRRGQQIRRGEALGTVGNTGWSTSPHLHYEVRVIEAADEEPTPVDPRIYILNYQWKGHEDRLVSSRTAPAPSFDPLPSRLKVR